MTKKMNNGKVNVFKLHSDTNLSEKEIEEIAKNLKNDRYLYDYFVDRLYFLTKKRNKNILTARQMNERKKREIELHEYTPFPEKEEDVLVLLTEEDVRNVIQNKRKIADVYYEIYTKIKSKKYEDYMNFIHNNNIKNTVYDINVKRIKKYFLDFAKNKETILFYLNKMDYDTKLIAVSYFCNKNNIKKTAKLLKKNRDDVSNAVKNIQDFIIFHYFEAKKQEKRY